MDPTQAMQDIVDCESAHERSFLIEDLTDWTNGGGFCPPLHPRMVCGPYPEGGDINGKGQSDWSNYTWFTWWRSSGCQIEVAK